MGFLKFVLWVLLIYYFFKLVFGAIKKYAFHKIQQQQEMFGKQFGGADFQEVFKQYQQQQQANQNTKVGETTVHTNAAKAKKKGKKSLEDAGEYIDYEEA